MLTPRRLYQTLSQPRFGRFSPLFGFGALGWCLASIFIVWQLTTLHTSVNLSFAQDLLFSTFILSLFQLFVAYFPFALFLATLDRRPLRRLAFIFWPWAFVVGHPALGFILEQLNLYLPAFLAQTTAVTTFLNSPQAALLLLLTPFATYACWRMFRTPRYVFFGLTALAFLSMNVIYHTAVIQWGLMYDVHAIQQEQTRAIEFARTPEETQQFCKIKAWDCAVVTRASSGFNFRESFPNISSVTVKRLDARMSLASDGEKTLSWFNRNFSIRQDEPAFIAHAIRISHQPDAWFLILDTNSFGRRFIQADFSLSTLLLFGNLFWCFMMYWILGKHQHHPRFQIAASSHSARNTQNA